MKRVKNRITAYINEKLKHEDQFDSIKNRLNLQKNNYKEKYNFMKSSQVLKIVFPVIILVVAVVVGVILVRNPNPQMEKQAVAVIQMDVNPSVSFVIDEDEVVISIYGENDEGKMIIINEEIVGLKLSEAIEKIIEIESETGYLLKGKVDEAENKITVTIESFKDQIAEEVQMNISSTINKVCEALKIQENLEIVKSTTKEHLIKRVKELDPTITEEQISQMTNQQLVSYISGCQLEKINIPTEEIENLYNKIKTQELQLVEQKTTKTVIDGLDSTYQFLIENYDKLYQGLIIAQDAVNEAYVKNFIDEESSYQKALITYQNNKLEVLKLENEISQMEDSVEKTIQQQILVAKKLALDSQLKSLDLVKQIADKAIELLNQAINIALDQLTKFYAELPDEIKTKVNESLSNLEEKVNETKENLFKQFEEKYGDIIKQAYENSKKYKESLIEQLKKK